MDLQRRPWVLHSGQGRDSLAGILYALPCGKPGGYRKVFGWEAVVHSSIERTYKALGDEHRQIMHLVERIEQHQTLVHLVPLLEELHELLINHFAREQFPGGLYESLGAYDSTYHDELRVLVQDHCLILSSMRGVLERARVANEEQETDILDDVATVIGSLYEHEHREHALAEKLLRE